MAFQIAIMVVGSDERRSFSKESKTRGNHIRLCALGAYLAPWPRTPKPPQPLVSRSRSQFRFSVMHKKGPPRLRAQVTHGGSAGRPHDDQHYKSVDPICDLFV